MRWAPPTGWGHPTACPEAPRINPNEAVGMRSLHHAPEASIGEEDKLGDLLSGLGGVERGSGGAVRDAGTDRPVGEDA